MIMYSPCLGKKKKTNKKMQTKQHIPDYYYVKIRLITSNTEQEKIVRP